MASEIYLDNSATTQPYREVVEEMCKTLTDTYGNPSSLHRKGLESERKIEQAREIIAKTIGVKKQEIFFTSGGTEANNLAVQGIAKAYRMRGKHIISSQIEHKSVLDVLSHLEEEGYRVTYLPVDEEGRVRPSDLANALQDDTILVSIMYTNNETGAIQPIDEIGEILTRHRKVLFHVDAVQAYGKVPLRLKENRIDLLTMSAHKIHGPKGVGALYVRSGVHLQPLVFGGGQEHGVRSGTENVAGIAGFAKAVQMTFQNLEETRKHMCKLRDALIAGIRREIPDARINTPLGEHAAPHIVNVSFPGVRGEVLVHALETEGIYVSTGSACTSKEDKYSHVLAAMGLSEPELIGSIRLSFAKENTPEEVETTVQLLKKIVNDLRVLSRR
ncbi:cysteine desulfurase [Collibacillus ludicampi]|uniref:Cysteine desulfurase n=1 Tax=Collibacillus ludicampi TaxID=2771369 RepID=A0AAV4LM55_9BACL|nr:cysteine desulfurase family protein [Collibacillus ludicampi]GIM48324.1 cysteine desulfurase [Collibacillus ludicampi]